MEAKVETWDNVDFTVGKKLHEEKNDINLKGIRHRKTKDVSPKSDMCDMPSFVMQQQFSRLSNRVT